MHVGLADFLFPQFTAQVRALAEAVAALEQQTRQANERLQVLDALVGGFQRVDASLNAVGEHVNAVDQSVGRGVQMALQTIWEAKAALSAELKDLPQLLVDSGVGGGAGGVTADGVPIGALLSPNAPRADFEATNVDRDVEAFGKDISAPIQSATKEIIAALEGVDFSPMARNSPELKGIDWAPYIEFSKIRVAHTLKALKAHAPSKARVLDFGSYFGNFATPIARAGYKVDALDSYKGPFGGALAPFVALMEGAGARVQDVGEIGYDLAGYEPETFDVVMLMSAIEHIPHTPRHTLEAIHRVLKKGGVFILDTPNLGYAYNRRRFASGQSVWPPIEHQYETELPFFGHHREFMPGEVRWMLDRAGFTLLDEAMFNYSFYGMPELRGEHLGLWRLMEEHAQLRELIFTVSRKP